MIYQTQLEFIARVIVSALGITLSAILAVTFVLEHIDLQLTDPNNVTTIFNLLDNIANSNGTSGNVTIPTESYIAEDGQTNPDINLQTLAAIMELPNIEEITGLIEAQTGELTAAAEAAAVEVAASVEAAAASADGSIGAQTVALLAGIGAPHNPLSPLTSLGDVTHYLQELGDRHDPLSPSYSLGDVTFYIEQGNDHLETIREGTDRISGLVERLDYTNVLIQSLNYTKNLVNITEEIMNNDKRLEQLERNSNITVQQNDAILQSINTLINKLDTIISKLTSIDLSTKVKETDCVPGFPCTFASQMVAAKTYYLNQARSFIDPALLQYTYNICNNDTC